MKLPRLHGTRWLAATATGLFALLLPQASVAQQGAGSFAGTGNSAAALGAPSVGGAAGVGAAPGTAATGAGFGGVPGSTLNMPGASVPSNLNGAPNNVPGSPNTVLGPGGAFGAPPPEVSVPQFSNPTGTSNSVAGIPSASSSFNGSPPVAANPANGLSAPGTLPGGSPNNPTNSLVMPLNGACSGADCSTAGQQAGTAATTGMTGGQE